MMLSSPLGVVLPVTLMALAIRLARLRLRRRHTCAAPAEPVADRSRLPTPCFGRSRRVKNYVSFPLNNITDTGLSSPNCRVHHMGRDGLLRNSFELPSYVIGNCQLVAAVGFFFRFSLKKRIGRTTPTYSGSGGRCSLPFWWLSGA